MPQSSNIVLVYFNCRGVAHTIRMLLLEMQVSFTEIHISLQGGIPQCLAEYNINISMVPCIIDGQTVITQVFPSIKYLCKKFHRLDLLGSNLYNQTKLTEVMHRYVKEKCAFLCCMHRNITIFNKNSDKMAQIKNKMDEEIQQIKWLAAACTLYASSGTFVLHQLTVLDFYFYQICLFMENMFFDIGIKKKRPIYSAYKNFFEKTDFFLKNKDIINNYPVLIPELNLQVNVGLGRMLGGDKNLLQGQ